MLVEAGKIRLHSVKRYKKRPDVLKIDHLYVDPLENYKDFSPTVDVPERPREV